MREFYAEAAKLYDVVVRGGAYLSNEIKSATSGMVVKLVHGALEQDVKSDYILSQFVSRRPKPLVRAILKVGIYALLELDNVPDYAIVSECVEATRLLGKDDSCGFVNGVLKKVARREYTLPKVAEDNYLSVNYSKPQWFIDILISVYGTDLAKDILSAQLPNKTNVRVNLRRTSISSVKSVLDAHGSDYSLSSAGGFFTRITDEIKEMFKEGLVTYQSASSMFAVQAFDPKDGGKYLDLCAAPGGKAEYIAELCPTSTIIACDVHPHRVELINKYCQRMQTKNILTKLMDATIFDPEFEGVFDGVIVDVPCSCLGTYKRHPDVLLRRDLRDIFSLQKLQRTILENAVKYLKDGGVLVYSTCTITNEENAQNADFIEFKLGLKPDFIPCLPNNVSTVSFLPMEDKDGFFIARFKKC